jgi:hypothetical protein
MFLHKNCWKLIYSLLDRLLASKQPSVPLKLHGWGMSLHFIPSLIFFNRFLSEIEVGMYVAEYLVKPICIFCIVPAADISAKPEKIACSKPLQMMPSKSRPCKLLMQFYYLPF